MPISSGALDWPTSYYSKPEKEAMEVIDGGDGTPRGTKKSPRGVNPQGYEWQPQLTNREDYEKWRKEMDRKNPLKTRRKKRGGCCGILPSTKINTENEIPTNGEQRDSPREIIKRRRRRRCLLLGCGLSVFSFLLLAVFVFFFLCFAGHEFLGLEDVECTGQWRVHFLGYRQTLNNGTTVYYCCYIPDIYTIDNMTVYSALSKSGWPDGYLVPQKNCPSPTKTCEEFYKDGDFARYGITARCGSCGLCPRNVVSFFFLALFSWFLK